MTNSNFHCNDHHIIVSRQLEALFMGDDEL